MTKKEAKQLKRAYTKHFKLLQKDIFIDKQAGLVLFVEYLKFLRDSTILTEYYDETESCKLKIASIITAIAEFDAYKYAKDTKQKTFHWNSFCELLKQNMEDWLNINDSV